MSAPDGARGRVVAIGIFDGVHRGHQALVARACAYAAKNELHSAALTFHPHPAALLVPQRAPKLLQPLWARLATLVAFGIGECHELRFDQALAQMDYETFVDDILQRQLRAVHVIVGDDFAFGRGRMGTPERFAALAHKRGFTVDFVPAVLDDDGQRISSTRVRSAVAAGDLQRAHSHLGRPFTLLAHTPQAMAYGDDALTLARDSTAVWPKEGHYHAQMAERPCEVEIAAHLARIRLPAAARKAFDMTRARRSGIALHERRTG